MRQLVSSLLLLSLAFSAGADAILPEEFFGNFTLTRFESIFRNGKVKTTASTLPLKTIITKANFFFTKCPHLAPSSFDFYQELYVLGFDFKSVALNKPFYDGRLEVVFHIDESPIGKDLILKRGQQEIRYRIIGDWLIMDCEVDVIDVAQLTLYFKR